MTHLISTSSPGRQTAARQIGRRLGRWADAERNCWKSTVIKSFFPSSSAINHGSPRNIPSSSEVPRAVALPSTAWFCSPARCAAMREMSPNEPHRSHIRKLKLRNPRNLDLSRPGSRPLELLENSSLQQRTCTCSEPGKTGKL